MSNKISIVRTKFISLHAGDVVYGYRMSDEYGAVFKDDLTCEDMELSPKDFFTKIQMGFNEDQDSMVADGIMVTGGVEFDGKWYDVLNDGNGPELVID